MTTHPTADMVARYRRGDLDPEALLAIDDHLASCEQCRTLSLNAPSISGVRAITALADHGADHPPPDALEAFVDAQLAAEARRGVESHLASCQQCRDDVDDLMRVRMALDHQAANIAQVAGAQSSAKVVTFPGTRVGTRSRWVATTIGLAGLATAAALAWLLVAPDAPGISSTTSPTVSTGPSTTASATAAVAPVIVDAGRALRFEDSGGLDGLPASASRTDVDAVGDALRTRRLRVSAEVSALRGPSGALMGGGGANAPLTVVSPVFTAVESDRPAFRWTPAAGATSYRVAVYSRDFDMVAQSPSMNATTWTPSQPLPRDTILTWQVTATTASGLLTAPAPPAPEARFSVVSARVAREVEALRTRSEGSRLIRAVGYAEAGLVEAARDELAALERDNPGSALVQQLVASLGQQ